MFSLQKHAILHKCTAFFFFFKEEEIYNVAAAITFDTVDEITVEEEVWV